MAGIIARRRLGEAGFGIVDMAMTLVVLGVIVSLAISSVDSSAWRLGASVTQVRQRARVARAPAVLSQTCSTLATWTTVEPQLLLRRAKAAMDRAFEIDPDLPEAIEYLAHLARGRQ